MKAVYARTTNAGVCFAMKGKPVKKLDVMSISGPDPDCNTSLSRFANISMVGLLTDDSLLLTKALKSKKTITIGITLPKYHRFIFEAMVEKFEVLEDIGDNTLKLQVDLKIIGTVMYF